MGDVGVPRCGTLSRLCGSRVGAGFVHMRSALRAQPLRRARVTQFFYYHCGYFSKHIRGALPRPSRSPPRLPLWAAWLASVASAVIGHCFLSFYQTNSFYQTPPGDLQVLQTRDRKEFYKKTPSHDTGHGTIFCKKNSLRTGTTRAHREKVAKVRQRQLKDLTLLSIPLSER